MKRTLLLTLFVATLFQCYGQDETYQLEWDIHAKSTFIHVSKEDTAVFPPLIIDLRQIGINQGDTIKLSIAGNFIFQKNKSTSNQTLGVFSTSKSLLSEDKLKRVTGAIEYGEDKNTVVTCFGKEQTDISEDFLINDLTLAVPRRAKYLFVCAYDSFYGDNLNGPEYKLILERINPKFEMQINNTNVNYIKRYNVEKETIKLTFWDKQQEDGDIITLYLNNEIIAEKLMVKKKPQTIKVKLNKGKNSLVMYAENLGKFGKNTAACKIKDKSGTKVIVLNSDKGVSQGIIIKR